MHGLSIEAVEWLPSSDESGLIRVRARWGEGAGDAALPDLLVRAAGREHRFGSLPDAGLGRAAGAWRGSYLVPPELVDGGCEAMWLESGDGARVALPALTRDAPGPAERPERPVMPADDGAQVIDRAVLAERRARRAEAAEQEQADAAADARVAVEALEAQAAEDRAARDAALAGAAELRVEAGSWHRSLRAAETARTDDATRLASLRVELAAVREDARRRQAELEAQLRGAAVARAALEDELDRARAASAAQREELADAKRSRDAAEAALAHLRGELAASVAARDTASAALSTAEMAVDDAARELRSLRADLEAERAARAAAEDALAAREESLQDRIAALAAVTGESDLARLAREQAEAAAATRAEAEPLDLAARLDAAAAALREREAPADEESPDHEAASHAADPDHDESSPAPETPALPLRAVLVRLAQEDAAAAARVLAGLLPAQGAVLEGPLAYDLTIRELGTFGIDIAEGSAAVTRLDGPRRRRQAAFHLTGSALTLAELLAGTDRRIGRFFGPARIRGRRRALAPLRALPGSELTLAAAARAGAALEPALAWPALALAVRPAWTAGLVFTVAAHVGDAGAWYLTARDGGGLAASTAAPEGDPAATVRLTRAAFDRLLREEPHPRDDRPSIRGDHEAVAALIRLIGLVRSAG